LSNQTFVFENVYGGDNIEKKLFNSFPFPLKKRCLR